MANPIILTGLRANNNLHLGNYIGALRNIIDLQSHEYPNGRQINLFIPDLHSITDSSDPRLLQKQIFETLKMFVAAGLDISDPNIYIYRQSYIPAHSELTVILNNYSYMGELSRMTQFKDKSKSESNINVGLFDYPVLMAADILLYRATHVPVGEDQNQHLELTRNLAIRMNHKFGVDLFTVPKVMGSDFENTKTNNSLRIRDLADPSKKMSKSTESKKGVIYLSDDAETAKKKIMNATTDASNKIKFDLEHQPGISNLILILASLRRRTVDEIEIAYKQQSQYGPFKQDVAEEVAKFLSNFRKAYDEVRDTQVKEKLLSSEATMKESAEKTLLDVQKAVGLR